MNRKQRRAQASTPQEPDSADNIPLSQPDRSARSTDTKTLFEIAAEKQQELLLARTGADSHGTGPGPGPGAAAMGTRTAPKVIDPKNTQVVNIRIGADGKIVQENISGGGGGGGGGGRGRTKVISSTTTSEDNEDAGDDVDDAEPLIPPFLDTLTLAFTLSAIHFTLETLTVHQYAQELRFAPIIRRAVFVAFPFLFVLIHLFRGHLLPLSLSPSYSYSSSSSSSASPSASSAWLRKWLYYAQQAIYVGIANVAGCYLIQVTNDSGYYAVMKNAPSVGTIWVWAVIELGLVGALAGVIGPGIYAWRYGYGIF